MRRQMLVAAALMAALTTVPTLSYAQSGRRDPEADQRKQQEESAKKRKQKEEWGDNQAPLQALRNAGPCPFVKSLYDAARYVDFKDNREASANVGFSGEIQGISAGCAYKDDQPIQVTMEVLFEMGKGPQASGRQKTYRYWVAVTDRNKTVLAKETFELPVTFPEGTDRVYVTENIGNITIPRASTTTSGSNFEVLIGFEVTPQMAAFNREGKRFRLNVGQASTTSNTPSQ
ncbi:MAG: Tat pathway signal sequence domain protein [Alphaproteobacteria bacterium]|nr:Tat pathway signal sequence domain protein [Alphaproteobacteria bacterium]MBU1512716.1 Tat pathway signal sequence domain protein [Alphaproteobacteria bacterium]MBU2096095.1 Tat pathway signal sequence domain protein [Alphaproteobacteria bacterium]MBU2152451.1 Tat pathway signal sequence domain protein [Alphaproteobacteria bacterium]MBU2308015.1 Tat pathway signal sequence domain protein [Alphaproteobacteria bacterium]